MKEHLYKKEMLYNISLTHESKFFIYKHIARVKFDHRWLTILRILGSFPFICANKFSFIRINLSLKDFYILRQYYQNDMSVSFQYMWRRCTIKNFVFIYSQNLCTRYHFTLFCYDAGIYPPLSIMLWLNMAFAQFHKNTNENRKYRKLLKFNKF